MISTNVCVSPSIQYNKFDALRDVASFLQFKKYEKHQWRGATLILK